MSHVPVTNTPRAYGHVTVSTGASFGQNVTIYQYSTICDEARIGDNVVIGSGAWIGRGVTIGDGTRIQHGAFLPNHTIVGKQVFIGPNATMCDDRYPRVNRPYKAEPPILGDHCSIGAGAVILPGVQIGHHAVIGAGAVVSRDIPPFALAIGVPARVQTHNSDKESYGNPDEDPSHY